MFSANENIVLRQHKLRIVKYVEDTIDEDLLDLGTSVLVMQATCRAPGCVPLETIITIVFPSREAIPKGLTLTKHETTFQTKILMPMSEVSLEDVLEALPPAFNGGLRTLERVSLKVRDSAFAQITQLLQDFESRKYVAEYMQNALQDFIENNCEAPEYGQNFSRSMEETQRTQRVEIIGNTGNIIISRDLSIEEEGVGAAIDAQHFVHHPTLRQRLETTNTDLRSNHRTLENIASLEYLPGVRPVGCPCCDPENPSNIADSMMML